MKQCCNRKDIGHRGTAEPDLPHDLASWLHLLSFPSLNRLVRLSSVLCVLCRMAESAYPCVGGGSVGECAQCSDFEHVRRVGQTPLSPHLRAFQPQQGNTGKTTIGGQPH